MASIGFPLQEPDICTYLNFYKYQRIRPAQATPNLSLVQTIRLPLPLSIPENYSVNTNQADLDILGNNIRDMMSAGKASLESVKLQGQAGSAILEQIKDLGVKAAAVTPGISDTNLGKLAQVSSGVVRNPHTTAIFNGVNLRETTLSWKVSPRSAQESRAINSIITAVKTYMHPEISMGGFALDYPNLATVVLKGVNGVGNKNPDVRSYMTYVRHSFIKNFQINNSGAGVPAFYKDGSPVEYEFSISFQEVNILTRNELTGRGISGNMPGGPVAGAAAEPAGSATRTGG